MTLRCVNDPSCPGLNFAMPRSARLGSWSGVLPEKELRFVVVGISDAYHTQEAIALRVDHKMDDPVEAQVTADNPKLATVQVPGVRTLQCSRPIELARCGEPRGAAGVGLRVWVSCRNLFCRFQRTPRKVSRTGRKPANRGAKRDISAPSNAAFNQARHDVTPSHPTPTETTPDRHPHRPAPRAAP